MLKPAKKQPRKTVKDEASARSGVQRSGRKIRHVIRGLNSRVNIPAPLVRLSSRDAVLELVTRLDVGVPQGRGRFDAEASEETADFFLTIKKRFI
jgi:hypothetical protein